MSDVELPQAHEDEGSGRSLFRAMSKDGGGTPVVGPGDLGVREVDLQPDPDGLARPRRGGMSVAPDDPMSLPIFRRPPSLAGTGKKPVWSISDAALTPSLSFRQDSASHGLVEPASAMPWQNYLHALSETGPTWALCHE